MQLDWSIIIQFLAVISPFLLIGIGGIGWLYRHEKERREAVERQLSEHKHNAYIELLNIFFDVLKSTKEIKSIDQADLIGRMLDANKNLILYGSDDVVGTYHKWLGSARKGGVNLGQFGEIMISIRRDMGNPKTKLTSDEVLRQLITDYDDEKAKGLIWD